jgi:ABC-type tungstate transport system substrate-binding protein
MAVMVCAAASAVISAMMYIRHRPKGTVIALIVAGVLSFPTVLAPILAVVVQRMITKEESGRNNR